MQAAVFYGAVASVVILNLATRTADTTGVDAVDVVGEEGHLRHGGLGPIFTALAFAVLAEMKIARRRPRQTANGE